MKDLQEIGKALVEVLKFIGKAVGFVIENWKVFAAIGGIILLSKMGGWIKNLFKFGDAADEVGESMSERLASSVREVGEAAQENKGGLLALGGAIALVAAGVAVAAYGVAELVRSFGEAGDNAGMAVVGILAFGAVMIGLVAVFMTLAPAAAVAAGPMLALGAAMFLLGAGVGLAALGMAELVRAFATMFGAIDVEKMAAVTVFFGSLATLAIPLGLAAISIAGLAVSLGTLQLALAFFDEEDTLPLTNMLQSFAGTVTADIDATTVALKGLIAEVERIPEEKAIALTNTLKTAAVAGPAVIAATTGMKLVTDVVHKLVGGKDENGKSVHPPINMNVALNLDGKPLDDHILKIVNEEIKKSSRQ